MIPRLPINIRSKVKVTGSKVQKKSQRDSRAVQSRCAVSLLNETALHARRELCTLLSAQPLVDFTIGI